jgi:tetratricopeptide (TPR) repeat protein
MMGQASYDACPIFFMFRPVSKASISLLVLGVLLSGSSTAQTAKPKPPGSLSSPAQQGLSLAKAGHCEEALPLLRKSAAQLTDKDLKREVGFAGVRCAMSYNRPDAAVEFLRLLNREFPHDPDVLYISVHTYSDLSTWAAQELATTAPDSHQAHELNAESLELQGKWDQAASEYRRVLEQDPRLPGIHFRLAPAAFQAESQPSVAEDAEARSCSRKSRLTRNNAGAEYVPGELARQRASGPRRSRNHSRRQTGH